MTHYEITINSFDPDTGLSGPSHEFHIRSESAELAVINAMQQRLIAIAEQKDIRPGFTALPMVGLHISLPDQEEQT